ncbi:MAG: phosphoglucomutase/phosphomannomutase family protein [Dehalococcoidia bacterium]|nr:phosphomannomutase [Chloroflexota bacterium]
MKIQFGTEGWRALIDQDFNLGNVQICAQATAEIIKAESTTDIPRVIVGYDTRLKSDLFAEAVAEVLAGNNIHVSLTKGPVPTPVVSHAVWSNAVDAGVVITASHNPPQYNGYKLKMHDGSSASTDTVNRLETHIRQLEKNSQIKKSSLPVAINSGLVKKTDIESPYIEHLRKILNLDRIGLAGIKIVHDPMYGSGIGYFSKLFSGQATKVKQIHSIKNPDFPGIEQPEPVENNLSVLSNTVKSNQYDIGIANDGDADRVGILDENGRFVTALETFALICLYELEILNKRGPIIRSLTQTNMVDRLGQIYGVPVIETNVGFKHIAPLIDKHNALAAGEESGGFTIDGHMPDRDGILCGLLILDMMVRTGKSVRELIDWLFSIVGPHYYKRLDIKFKESDREKILQKIDKEGIGLMASELHDLNKSDGFKFNFKNGSWMLIRFSGTEPLLRTYAEGNSQEEVEALLTTAQELITI